jgi:hypothetical protein
VFAIDSDTIKKRVASDQKQLHAGLTPAFEELGDVRFLAEPDIHGDAGIFTLKFGILTYLSIKRQDNANLMATLPQLSRQCVHHVDKSTSAP